MRRAMVRWTAVLLGLYLASAAMAQEKPADCRNEQWGWSDSDPAVNLRHVLCGEIKKDGKVVGMHSRAMLIFAPVKDVQADPPMPSGLYNARVTFTNDGRKTSTFFPDNCTAAQIEHSILHALHNRIGPAKPWGDLGCTAPPGDDGRYCRGPQGQRFVIRYGTLPDGRVNTAFPQMGETCP